MISTTLQLFMIAAVVAYFCLLISLLKKKTLNLKYALLWILSGVIMAILAVFPRLLDSFSNLIGVASPTNALFAVIFFCVIMILMSLTAIVSSLNNKVKQMAQSIALLERKSTSSNVADSADKFLLKNK